MLLRLFAITVFALLVGPATPVMAGDFAKHYIPTNPPKRVEPFTFVDEKGRQQDLKGYRGRYILLNLWAAWCAPCVEEMPSLNALRNSFDFRDLNIIALNEDRSGIDTAKSFYKRRNLKNLLVYSDPSGQAPSLLKTHGLPTTLLIDREGNEIGRFEGAIDWSSPDAIAFLQAKIKR